MRIALFGYSQTGQRALRTLLEMGESVVAVFTHPDDPGEKIWFDSVPRLAREHGIPVHEVPSTSPKKRLPGGPAGYERLVEEARPDMILSASFRALIPRDVLNIPPRGSLNLHPSLLPRYRGRSPVNWVLVNGETETGMSLHHMVEAPDAGDIVGQVRLPIGPDETAPELQRRMDDVAETLLRRLLPQIGAGAAPRIPQDPAQSSYFGRRRPEDGRFEWSWPASRIHDLVRAVTRPYPGAFVLEPAGRLFVWRTRVLRDRSGLSLRPGETVTSSNYPHPVAGTGDGIIEILDSSRDKA